ncbi:MAG: hypothetical protein QGH59_02010, partial [Gemmatimonadota bacterium]|nr:hypothetical protein [Gemmatimonadota bacterium]
MKRLPDWDMAALFAFALVVRGLGLAEPTPESITRVLVAGISCAALGAAGRVLSGHRIGLLAGALLAASPHAVQDALLDSAGIGVVALVSAALAALASYARKPGLPLAIATGAFVGGAAAFRPGALALLVALPFAPGSRARFVAAAFAAAVAVFFAADSSGPLNFAGSLATGFPAAMPGGPSPLIAAARALLPAAGAATLLLALPGAAAIFRRRDRSAGVVIWAALFLTLGMLLDKTHGPAGVFPIVPTIQLLAAYGVAHAASLTGRRHLPPPLTAGVVAVLLALSLHGSVRGAAGHHAPTPGEEALRWIRANLTPGDAILAESGSLPKDRGGLPIHDTIPRTSGALESGIVKDPHLSQMFPYALLSLPPSTEPARPDPIQNAWATFLTDEWEAAARFEARYPREPSLLLLRRPEGFRVEGTRVKDFVAMLRDSTLSAARDTSSLFTDWLLDGGTLLRATGSLRQARVFLAMAVERSPALETHYQLALALLLLEEEDAALEAFLLALADDPFHGGCHFNVGT